MKRLHLIGLVLSALMFSTSLPARSAGPDDRQITDPKSIISASNLRAHPVPIDDLYFTRSVSDASWSPDGTEILFITNMAGRPNLWKMSSTGGWPIQLVQSEERQLGWHLVARREVDCFSAGHWWQRIVGHFRCA
jgi:dipeptidyl aminopeptidase/acylaminoacyl peptidase